MKLLKQAMVIGLLTASGALAASPITTLKVTNASTSSATNFCSQGTDPSYIGIPVLSFNLTGDNPVTISGGPLSSSGRPTFGGVKITKPMDQCTVSALNWLMLGTRLTQVELRVYDANKIETMRVTLFGAYTIGIVYAPGQEGITLNSEKLDVLHIASNTRFCWDFNLNQKCQ